MKIAYVTTYNTFNSSAWTKHNIGNYSSSYYILKTLIDQEISIDTIGNLKKNYSWLTKGKWSFYKHCYHQDYYRWAEPKVCKNYALQINKHLSKLDVDIVLCTEGFAPIAYLKCQQPLVLWVDTVLAALINFYPYLSNLCHETKRNIYVIEKLALNKCNSVIFTSEWAAQKAIDIYNIDANKVKVIPRGSNLELQPERTVEDIKYLIDKRGKDIYKLIFIGIDWQRKGGDIAIEVTKELKRRGFNVELKIIGDLPTNNRDIPSFIKTIGYINKSIFEEKQHFYNLLADSHFLILPTKADVTPNVLIEANAFGVPSITTNVGGIPSIIKDDVNGKTFPLDANIKDYCNYIANYLNDYQKYETLALSSFNEYVNRLNWSIGGKTAKQLFFKLIQSR
ncbi:glycosyltransferase family 4 protein [Nostocaceae cyanobacterium CENA369]|uniref:Glycosyltransferase family 4 protein n=1 Tax=Dendronalium phyllosphericum CENA369 TaxID=1725256 RepID=A0A8J7I8X9_9NOST|nr:glycosyltransferase family 4 protein [Dendronalium phyllosphericum]MBH8576098.1 glycosyltransferase family 4 protein [Dendronalium phyllosphericum CENA369]